MKRKSPDSYVIKTYEPPKPDPATYWRERFHITLAGLSYAVGMLGEDAGYASVVHARMTSPMIVLRDLDLDAHEIAKAVARMDATEKDAT